MTGGECPHAPPATQGDVDSRFRGNDGFERCRGTAGVAAKRLMNMQYRSMLYTCRRRVGGGYGGD